MFKLKLKDGAEVSTLEELRDNFDLERVVEYFKSGKLLEWLEDRFYDDEADAISAIGKGDDYVVAKICAALNVECDDNLEFMKRVREKKSILSEKTDDETIIDNAVSTALNQEDLAALIQMDYKTIYLCGEKFNVPIRVAGVKYIGILGTPKIKIRANSQEEVDAKQISFENVQLPWQKASTIEELKALAEKIFQTGGKFPVVSLMDKNYSEKFLVTVSSFDQLSKAEQSAALRMVCQGKYSESQIAFMQLTEDLSSGFALTVDSFCTGGGVGSNLILYKEIKNVGCGYSSSNGYHLRINEICLPASYNDKNACEKLLGEYSQLGCAYNKIENFLKVVKNF